MSCKPKSRGLRMADGGELMKRFASRQPTLRAADGGMFVPGENQGGANAQMYGRMSADLAQPAAATPTVDPGRRDHMLSAAHSVPQFQPMAVPGLRDGGDLRTGQGGNVPGSGAGDKIPAKYEPGEFVVSNDMLDAAPQLRSQLRDLRGNVLAAKGMTPEQADAKALGYDGSPSGGQDGQQEAGLPGRSGNRRGGERASLRDAGSEAGVQRRDGGWGPSAGLGANGAQGGDTGIGRSLRPVHQVGLRALDGFETTERPWNGSQDARTFAQQPGPGNPNVGPNGSSQAQAFQQARAPSPAPAPAPAAAPAPAPAPTAATPKPTLRAGIAGETGALSKSLYAGGRAVAPIAKLAGALAPVAIGGEIVNHFNDYKINDPGVDSSFVGNVRDVSNGDYGKAWSGFKKGALEAGMDLGSFAANTLDYVVPGKAPVSTAYNRSLRNAFGDQLVPHGSVAAQAAAATAPQTPSAPTLREPNPYEAANAAKLAQAQTPTLRGRDPGQVNVTRQANGNLSFSGKDISGPVSYTGDGANDRPGLRNPGSTFSVMPAQDTSSLRNPDGSTWSAGDTAIMAANLRDGVDKYRGTSRGQTQDEAAPKRGEFGYNHYMANKVQQDQIKATLRGQDLDYQGKLANNKIGMFNALREQGNKDRDFSAGRFDKGLEQSGKMDEQARGAFKNRFDTLDKDGKPVARPDLESAAYEEVMRQNPNWSQLDPTQRARQIANAADHVKLIGNARDHQNNSIWQAVGVANKDNPHGRMPGAADLKGAQLEEVGLWDGLTKARVGRGDYKLTTNSNQVMHFGRDSMSDDQLGYLERAGVIAGQPRK